MPSIRSTLLLLALLSSAACEQTANPPAPAKPEAVTVQPVQAATDNSTAKVEPKKPALKRAEERAASTEAVQAKPKTVTQLPETEPAEPKHPLDLKLRPNVFDPLQPLAPLSEESTLLPPLFTEKVEPDSPFQLNGKLISNERDGDYWQSIEGAQLQFEFKQ